MSFDKSMLSLFSREALDACEKMRIAARSGDGELAVGAARLGRPQKCLVSTLAPRSQKSSKNPCRKTLRNLRRAPQP